MTPSIPHSAAALTLLFALCLAVMTDLRSRRIPNKLVLAGLLFAFAAHATAMLADLEALAGDRAWSPLTGGLTGFAALLPLYAVRACGAGDVKLMTMVGAFVGAETVLLTALYTLIAGGLLALVFMLFRGVAAQTLANVRFLLTDWMMKLRTGQGAQLEPLVVTAARLPYAVAIAMGTVAALLWPPAGF